MKKKKNDISKYFSNKIVKTCKKHAIESLDKENCKVYGNIQGISCGCLIVYGKHGRF
jgi:hypothetical protein